MIKDRENSANREILIPLIVSLPSVESLGEYHVVDMVCTLFRFRNNRFYFISFTWYDVLCM
jgi:hypothetical protein